MLSALLAGALIVAASLLLGSAIMAIAGLPRHSAAGPATGISALLVICGIAVKLPGHAVTAAAITGVALVGCFFVFSRTRVPAGTVRVGAIVAVIGAALVVAIPFATSGRVGILGQGLVNDDMASHLLFTEWITSHAGPTPDLIKDGYPLGPHAIVAATAKVSGASLIEAFAGLTGAIAVLLALTAYGVLGGIRGWLRVPAAVLAASPYLAAAYLAQGAFKEPLLALALLGFALGMPALRGIWSGAGGSVRVVIPLGRDRRGDDLQLQLPGPRLAAGRRDRLDAGHRAPRARPAPAGTAPRSQIRDRSGRRPPDRRRAAGDLPARQLLELQGVQPVWDRPHGRVRKPAPAAQPAGGVRGLALGRVPDHAGQLDDAGDRLLPRRAPGPGGVRLGPWAGAVPAGVRPAVGAARGDPALPRFAGAGHPLHPGEGPGDRRAVGHGDCAARSALGRFPSRRGVRRPRGGRCGLVAAEVGAPAHRLRRAVAHPRLRRRGGLLDPAPAAAGGRRARLPPPGDAPHPADRRRPERALPRPRQLRLLGVDRLGGLRADHQPLRRRGGPPALPGDRPERQVRLGQRPAVRDEQVPLGGHHQRRHAEPGATGLRAAAANRRLHPLAPRARRRPAPDAV